MDIRTAPAAAAHTAILRSDYRQPDWLVPTVALDFTLDPERSTVRATLTVERNGAHDRPLRLEGDEIELVAVRVDGKLVEPKRGGDALLIDIAGDEATIETEVVLHPSTNSKLMGLYASSGLLCTQC